MLLVNVLATFLFWWGAMFLYDKFLRPALLNNTRFKLFSLRDRLALLAMEGHISPNAAEYKHLMLLMNKSIKEFEDFSVTKYIRFLSKSLYANNQTKEFVKIIRSNNDPEFKAVVSDFCDLIQAVFNRQTLLFRYTLVPLVKLVVNNFKFLLRINKTLSELIVSRTMKVQEIETNLEATQNALA